MPTQSQTRKSGGRFRANGSHYDKKAAATGRAFVLSLLTPEEKKLKGSEREAVICGRLAIHNANLGNETKAKTFATLAVRSAKLATNLRELRK